MEHPTSAALLCRLLAAGGLPAHAAVLAAKGRVDWTQGDLRYRLSLKRGPEREARWTLFVGDRVLGQPFHEGGILALVPIRPVPETAAVGAATWPATDDEVPAFLSTLHAQLVEAVGFVRDLRDLCELLITPTDVRRGGLVADLQAGYVERVLRALCIARAAGDHDSASVALAIIHAAPADGPPGGPSSLLHQARIWADQWSCQSGRRIEVPDHLDDLVVAAPKASGLADLPAFWDRVG